MQFEHEATRVRHAALRCCNYVAARHARSAAEEYMPIALLVKTAAPPRQLRPLAAIDVRPTPLVLWQIALLRCRCASAGLRDANARERSAGLAQHAS